MLYKVTPMMPPKPEPTRARRGERTGGSEGRGPSGRKRKSTAVYDCQGREVLISLMCLKCRALKPLGQFGLRKMADGAVRNQPWCRDCRSQTAPPKAPTVESSETPPPVRALASL